MKIVIIGAGQTGRGYLARLAFLSGADIIFIDKDENLIAELNDKKKYLISFYGDLRAPIEISGYEVCHSSCQEAVDAISRADLIMTSVFANNLQALCPLLLRGFEASSGAFPPIMVCENGVYPGDALRAELPDNIQIGEALILCTTCADGLNIYSQDLDYLPYDAKRIYTQMLVHGFVPEYNFSELCIRKNYTYNCLSAVISYFGAEKGYLEYSCAANDGDIHERMLKTKESLDCVLSRHFSVSIEEQKEFSEKAILKFCDREIKDSIERNARDAKRKLGRNERIVGPLLLAEKYSENSKLFKELAASAVRYGIKEGSIEKSRWGIRKLLQDESKLESESVINDILDLVSLPSLNKN